MRSFITTLLFCSSILEFSTSRGNRGMWRPLIEKMRLLDDKFSEYIDTDLLTDKRAKDDPTRLSTKNNSRMKIPLIGSLKNSSMSTESISILPTTETVSKNYSGSNPGPKNYEQKFKTHDRSEEKTKPIVETVNWNFSLKPSYVVNSDKEIPGSETFNWNRMRTSSNKQTGNKRRGGKTNDSRNRRYFRILTERIETNILQSNIPLQYKPNYSVESNGEVLEESTQMSTSIVHSSKGLYSTTTSIINHSPKLPVFNRSSPESNINETLISSSVIHLQPPSNSKLSKTTVAAIVAVINGIIGFTGAAIFTCTKLNYLRGEERRPLIR